MGMMERGSFMAFLFSMTNLWLSFKLMEDVSAAVTTLFGSTAAACFVVAVILFRQEQRDLLINPLGNRTKEVHEEEIAKLGRGTWVGLVMWVVAIITGSVVLP